MFAYRIEFTGSVQDVPVFCNRHPIPLAYKRDPFLVRCVDGKVIIVYLDLNSFRTKAFGNDLLPEIAIKE